MLAIIIIISVAAIAVTIILTKWLLNEASVSDLPALPAREVFSRPQDRSR
jgi:hypothetical protein